jgi:alkaline phosphatase
MSHFIRPSFPLAGRLLAGFAVLAALAAAGTADSGADLAPQAAGGAGNLPPSVTINAPAETASGRRVTLTARVGDADGEVVAIEWRQVAGTPVRLDDASAADPWFVAPDTRFGSTLVKFRLRAIDDDGAVAQTTVSITVRKALPPAPQPAKYVILMIGDGMQLAHEVAASRYLTGEDLGLAWHQFPVALPTTTWDIDTYNRYALAAGAAPFLDDDFDPAIGYDPTRGGEMPNPGTVFAHDPARDYFLTKLPKQRDAGAGYPATDSASSGTTLASGIKTDAGNINWRSGDRADGRVTPISHRVQAAGGAIGVVSSVGFSHATPAVFVAQSTNRNNYHSDRIREPGAPTIAEQILDATQPDVMIGAGAGNPGPKGYLSSALHSRLVKGHYADQMVVALRESGVDGDTRLAAAVEDALGGGKRLFGLYGGPNGYMEHPVPTDTPGKPGFAWPTTENPSLASQMRAAMQLVAARAGDGPGFIMLEGGDIDWANHANDYAWMVGAMHNFHGAVQAAIGMIDDPTTPYTWDNTLLIVTSDHSNSYMRLPKPLGIGDLPRQVMGDATAYGNRYGYPDGEVSYGSGSHTNEPTMTYARGAGATMLTGYAGAFNRGTRLIDHVHIHHTMERALGLHATAR